ncbi:MFS transporter [Mangrovibacterium marinum]|uniref:GPH family glycoside/pentoside/hexuronide:cation symporter n=1 Tax=Mangrovibacterium marinum TaxID=1639118 RepID=A0A2T5C5E8_9BACT|nr:MFS transporter [Mangrovibacterium marinum]PTN10129.1 GPH family glycoside/pentoside/hexuronide:cation symporter [Mangrovibacterium marinum]
MNQPIKLKEKIGYSFGDFASSMFWKLFTMFLTIFYTDVVELTPAAVGTMLLLTRIWDSVNDPMMGIICDRTHTRQGKFRPYLFWVAIPFAIIGVLTFTKFNFGPSGKLIYAYITYTLMMMVYTAVNVPYSSLMGVMTPVPAERTTLASFRFLGAFAGGIFVTATAAHLIDFFKQGGASEAQGYQYTIAIYAFLAVVFFWLTYAWTKERVKLAPQKESSIKEDFKDLSKNLPWFIVLGTGVFALIFTSLRDGSMMYYFKYYIKDQQLPFWGEVGWDKLASVYMTLWLVCNMAGVALAKPLSDKFGKKWTYMWSMLLCSGISFFMYLLEPEQITLIFVLNIIVGLAAGIIMPLIWAMYADIADFSEWKTGRRATGLIFSSSSMSQKMGGALGGAITLWILAAYGFQANLDQTADGITGIKMIFSIYPAIGALVSALFIVAYRLSDKFMVQVTAELEQKRQGDNSGVEQ